MGIEIVKGNFRDGATERKMYRTDGYVLFVMGEDDILCYGGEDEYSRDEEIYDLFTGEDFINDIESGYISSYDGNISGIYLGDKRSNLGIFHDAFIDGDFLVTLDVFKDICKEYEVYVNWANK